MHHVKRAIHKTLSYARNHPIDVAVAVLSLVIFLIGSRYVDYPDEYVNLLGGRILLHGGLPYRDFWDHHLPGAWFGAAFLLFFSGGSFVLFRVLWALFAWAILVLTGLSMGKNHPLRAYFRAFLLLYPMAALYFWFHLFLADSVAVLFFSVAFWLIAAQWVEHKKHDLLLIAAGMAIFFMVFASATYVYMAAGLYLMLAYVWGFSPRRLVGLIAILLVPYVLFGLYVLLTGTWSDFYFANFVYNSTYYISIPNYVRGGHFNPIKFALTLVSNFYAGYMPLLSKIKHLDLYLPIATLSGLATLSLALMLAATEPFLALAYVIILSFSAPRSDVQNYKETDYQMAMFIALGLASTMLFLYIVRRISHREVVGDVLRVVRVVIFVFALSSFLFLGVNTYEKAFGMYTQKLPSIHNRGFTAEFFDEILTPEEGYFVGPYEPQDLFYTHISRYEGRHPSLLPQFRESPELRASFLADMEKTNPTLIVFKHEASIFGTPSLEFGAFFIDWMKPRYRSIEQIEGVEMLKTPVTFNLRTDVYVRDDKQKEILKSLEDHGYIKIGSVRRS